MSDIQRSTSPPNSTNLGVPEDEGIIEEDRSDGDSDGAAHSRASADAAILPPTSAPEGIENENEAASSHPQQTTTAPQNVPGRPARRETLFGIPRPSGAPNRNYDADYETRLPPDPIYQEASGDARVYRMYMEESAKYDASMIEEAREGLDVHLVFAGLFSAVLTTFVAQTSQSLQPDRATESTLLLREIAALQRAQINGTSTDSIPPTPVDFTPSAVDVWVNGLWFTSLTLSLASALFAVLIRQWLRHYMSKSGSLERQTRTREYRLIGLQKWHVQSLIGVLPLLMHLSLAIFFAGLTLFLAALRPSIASVVGCFSALVFGTYITTAIWPLVHTQCPYHTPLTGIIRWLFSLVRKYVLWNHCVDMQDEQCETSWLGHDLVVHAFEWLLSISANPSVRCVVTQAVGGLPYESPSINKLVHDVSFRTAWRSMFDASINRSPDGVCRIRPEKVDLLERLFRSALHIQDSTSFSWILASSDVCTAIQSFPAPTLQWESVATALLWHHGVVTNEGNFEDIALAQKASAVVHRFMSDPLEKETQLPAIVWRNLLAAASSCPGILLHKKITDELTSRVCFARERWPLDNNNPLPISLEEVLYDENFIWSLLSPFDKHKRNSLDSKQVQQLLSVLYAIVSRGLCEVSRTVFFATCKALICELQAGFVTLNDQEAVCVAADALLQERIAFQSVFGTNAVLLLSLLFLHCWKPHIPLRRARTDILVDVIEINMFHTLHEDKHWLWMSIRPVVASLIASLIRTSFELWTDLGARPEDLPWLKYLSLPENTTTIVSLFTFQGTMDAPASMAKVRDDLLYFFLSQELDCHTLQKCQTSLESHLLHFVPLGWWDAYKPNMAEAKKIIDEFISKQSPQSPTPANPLHRLLRRSRNSLDLEARYPEVELSPLHTTNTSSG